MLLTYISFSLLATTLLSLRIIRFILKEEERSIEKQITYNCPDKIKRGKLMR